MSKFKKNCKIYIIESQSDDDILYGRSEGKTLSSGLELAGINNQYFQVINEKMLDQCLEAIAEDILKLKPDLFAPFLHFSAHGNEFGIGLSNDDFIDWGNLREKIDSVNSKIGKVKLPKAPKLERSVLSLCFSVCEGFCATQIQGDFKENKYISLIGPTEAVDWSDSLLAYMTFYHQVFHKSAKAVTAVRIMNSAAGLDDIFKISPGYGNRFTE